jgi:hypothetical protein
MGQVEPALICYKKSALALENRIEQNRVNNQGFARQWIGELLLASDRTAMGVTFLTASYAKWSEVSPPRAAATKARLASELNDEPDLRLQALELAEREFQKWLFRK